MATCCAELLDEKKDDSLTLDHSLKNVVAFSTCKKQACGPSKEGLLVRDLNKKYQDRRIRINYHDKNFFLNCQMKSIMPSGSFVVGSGRNVCVNGVDTLLTCAHNLCTMSSFYQRLVKHKEAYAYSARYGEDKWFNLWKLKARGIRIHEKYNGYPSCGYDIAVCPMEILLHDKDDKTLFDGLNFDSTWGAADPKSLKVGMTVEVAGYPAEKNGYPYFHNGTIQAVSKRPSGGWILYYDIDSTPGMSGSPIMITCIDWIRKLMTKRDIVGTFERDDDVKKVIIGIHTGHDDTVMMNYGTLITPSLKAWILGKTGLKGWILGKTGLI